VTQFPHDPTVLITGAGGRLGRLLRRAARRSADTGDGRARLVFQSRQPGADLLWAPGDPLSALPSAGTVVALWGCTAGIDSELAENERLVSISQTVAHACGARRLLHLSSAAVYGPGTEMDETRPPQPVGGYGRAKLAMERAVARQAAGDAGQCCLRLANVVGADSLAAGLAGDGPVGLDRFAEGSGPVRSYIGASDVLSVLRGLAALSPGALPGLLNVAAPAPVRMEELVRAAGLAPAWRPAPATAVREVTLDATRLARLLPGRLRDVTAASMIADWTALESLP